MGRIAAIVSIVLIAGCASQQNANTVSLADPSGDWPFDRPTWAASVEPAMTNADEASVIVETQIVSADSPITRKIRNLIRLSEDDVALLMEPGLQLMLNGDQAGDEPATIAQMTRTRLAEGRPVAIDVAGDRTQMRFYLRADDIAADRANVQFEAQYVCQGQPVVSSGARNVIAGYTMVRPVDALSVDGDTCFVLIRLVRTTP